MVAASVLRYNVECTVIVKTLEGVKCLKIKVLIFIMKVLILGVNFYLRTLNYYLRTLNFYFREKRIYTSSHTEHKRLSKGL